MNKIRILTDSSSEFTKEELEKLNIECVSLRILIDEKEYLNQDLSNDEFYEKLEHSKSLPKTSQPSLLEFEKIFEDVKNNNEEMLVMVLGAELSGTVQVAALAKENVGYDKIHIFETNNCLGSVQILCYEACKMRDNGATMEEILTKMEELKPKINFFAVVDTLDYLKKGGRLSGLSFFIGNLLNIKPIVTCEGKIKPIAKVIGMNNAIKKVRDFVVKEPVDENYTVVFGYSKTKNTMEKMKETLKDLVNIEKSKLFSVGPVAGTYTGPNCGAIMYVKK